MARGRSTFAPLVLALTAAALLCLLGGQPAAPPRAFLPSATGAAAPAAPTEVDAPQTRASVALAGVAAPVVLADPAFAENLSPPGWPYLLVFVGLLTVVILIPNVIFRGKN